MEHHAPHEAATTSSFRLALIAILGLAWLAMSSYFLANEALGPALPLLGAVGVMLTPLVALEIGPRDRRWVVGTLLGVGVLGFWILEWFLRLEIHEAEWFGLRLALAAVRILPALLAASGFLLARRSGPGAFRRWAVGLTVGVFSTAAVPIASLYIVCYSGYDCL